MKVGEYRAKAREFVIRENAERMKITGKARLIDLQTSLKAIPAKSAINDIAGEFLARPQLANRIKKKGFASFLKSKIWG